MDILKDLKIDRDYVVPLNKQIAESIKTEIVKGKLITQF